MSYPTAAVPSAHALLLLLLLLVVVLLLEAARPPPLALRPPPGHARTAPAEADVRVHPLERPGHDVADVREVEEEEGHAYDGVHDGGELAREGAGVDVAVT